MFVVPLAAVLLGCSGTKPVDLPPQSLNEAANREFGDDPLAVSEIPEAEIEEVSSNDEESEVVSVDEVAAAAPSRTPRAASDDGSLVVIGGGDEEALEAANPLIAASAAERRRRQTAPAAVAVINDKNLAEFAEGGKLTIAEGSPDRSAEGLDAAASMARADEELYWRTRVRSLRAEWRESADLIAELEGQAEGLRRQFYAEDDPYVRDRRIKPEWDRTLDRLEEARRAVERSREELAKALEEGRRAGALPGWLRDGAELEPEPKKIEETPELDPEEPTVIDP